MNTDSQMFEVESEMQETMGAEEVGEPGREKSDAVMLIGRTAMDLEGSSWVPSEGSSQSQKKDWTTCERRMHDALKAYADVTAENKEEYRVENTDRMLNRFGI